MTKFDGWHFSATSKNGEITGRAINTIDSLWWLDNELARVCRNQGMDPVRLPCSYRVTPVVPTDPTAPAANLLKFQFETKTKIAEEVHQPTQLLILSTVYKPE